MSEPAVQMPEMPSNQVAGWWALMDLQERVPTGWTLVGGQMVHLHCAWAGIAPPRVTTDADTILDVRSRTGILAQVTGVLKEMGFEPETTGDGLQHRWQRDDITGREHERWVRSGASIDVMLPDGVGETARSRFGVGGAPTLETPGGSQALERSLAYTVVVEGRTGVVNCPSLLGALVMKAAAHTTPGDRARQRHRQDFVTLAQLVSARDVGVDEMRRKDRQRLRQMIAACRQDPRLAADRVVARLERAYGLSD